MNLLGWLITLTLATSSTIVIMSHGGECPCFFWRGAEVEASMECFRGTLFDKADTMRDNPKGSCAAPPLLESVTGILSCLKKPNCVDYLMALLKGLMVISLPLLVTHDKRVLIHAGLNAMHVHNAAVGFNQLDLVILLVLSMGIVGLEWDLGNGDGFFGPIRRYRARTANGRYA